MTDVAPVVLRHRDATRQAYMYGAFAVVLVAFPVVALLSGSPSRWWLLIFVPPALLVAYSALRLATLRVVLDASGVREPAPFRPTVLTPWDDVVQVQEVVEKGAVGLRFLGVVIVHRGGWKHQLIALNMSTRDPSSNEAVDEWIAAIRDAKRAFAR